MKIAIYQWVWGVGDFRVKLFCIKFIGNSGNVFGGRGVVESNFVINCNFRLFVFWWLWRWHESCNFSMNMGGWRL